MKCKVVSGLEPHSLRLVCLSDTHGLHRQVQVPEGDILIHAGDLTVFGQPLTDSFAMLEDVNAWLGELPHLHKVVIAGNHDLVFQKEPAKARGLLTNAHYLENSGVILERLHIWGSPITPVMEGMAFATLRGEASRRVWDRIPDTTDILITHGPPCGSGDQVEPWSKHWGCLSLTAALQRIQPALHVFGHIHGGYGRQTNRTGTQLVNCAVLNSQRVLANPPVVVTLQVP